MKSKWKVPFTKTKSLYLLDANLKNSKSVAAKRQNGLKVMGVLVKTKKYFFFSLQCRSTNFIPRYKDWDPKATNQGWGVGAGAAWKKTRAGASKKLAGSSDLSPAWR